MVDRILLREFDISLEEFDQVVISGEISQQIERFLGDTPKNFQVGEVIQGRVVEVVGDQVIVDIGAKSEALIPLHQWDDDEIYPRPGDPLETLLEKIEDDTSEMILSRAKPRRPHPLQRPPTPLHEGDIVSGRVLRPIQGGFLVDIGVNAFLPANQIDLASLKPSSIAPGQEIACIILRIEVDRRNIIVSHRRLSELAREQQQGGSGETVSSNSKAPS